MNAIASFMGPQNVLLDLRVANKVELFDAVARHIERESGVPQHLIVHCLSRREQAGSTGLGEGLAIPHARIEGLARIQALYVRLKSPIPFGATDGRPVSDVLVLLVPYPASDEHLRLLAEASQMFSDPRFREHLRASIHPDGVARLFAAWPDITPDDE
jgi:PTS system nitrogen regulatory IIA component